MEDSNTQWPLMSDAGDITQSTSTFQDTRHTDVDKAQHKSADHDTVAPVTDEKKETYRGLCSTWWMEIATICASFACIAGLVGILAGFQNRLTTEWTFFISLNAAIAIIITAARATLLATVSVCLSQEKWSHFSNKARRLRDLATIDKASRGPMGSLEMLCSVSWGFASISAIVFILSLFTDTFVQQVLYFEPGSIYSYQEGSATFGYAHGYSNGVNYNWASAAFPQYYESDMVNTDLEAAIFRGLYQTSWPSAFNCTSNCTWDQDYVTLGFRSTCANVAEKTIATVQCADDQTLDSFYDNGSDCNMTTPKGVVFAFYPRAWITSIATRSGGLNSIEEGVYNASDLVSAAVWAWKQGIDPGNVTVTPLKTVLQKSDIVECTLGVVLYKYANVSSISNNFTIGTTEHMPLGMSSGSVSFWTSSGNSDTLVWWNDTGPGLPDVFVSEPNFNVLVNFLRSPSFTGTLGDIIQGNATYNPGSTAAFGNGSLEVVSAVFDNVALSMTDLVRQSGAMQLAQGSTSQAVVYIRVRWLWLILPLAVQFLGAVALITTVMGWRRTRNVPLWKGSALAVLYHSVDKDGVLGTQVKNLEELKQIGKMHVMLERSHGDSDA